MSTIRERKPFRILSLDGGGTWALIQAKVLLDIYGPNRKGHEILRDFDLVAANSGGSIVAAGLIADMTPAEILALFMTELTREQLFQKLPFYRRLLRIIDLGPQFSTGGKLKGLTEVLHGLATSALDGLKIPNRSGSPIRFLITAFDYDRERAVFFRSDRNSPAANFPRGAVSLSAIEAVHASSTAPVNYFDGPAEFGSRRYWDGGMAGLNNPVLAAVVEAVAYGTPRSDIGVLSIGTGKTFLPVKGEAASPELVQAPAALGLGASIKKAASAVVADPPDTDSFIAYLMLGGSLPGDQAALPVEPDFFVRMNPLIRPGFGNGQWLRPGDTSASDFKALAEMDLAVTDDKDVKLIDRFCNGWMCDGWSNQPIRNGSDTDGSGAPNIHFCEIGHPTYSAAKAAW